MEYISNIVIQDGESKSVHPFPSHNQQEFSRWWKNLQAPSTSQQWPDNPYVKFTFKFFRQNRKLN